MGRQTIHPDVGEQRESRGHSSGSEEMGRPVLEPTRVGQQRMAIVLNGDVLHRSAGEPWPPQARQCVASRDERAEARWQAEELVEGERDELRLPAAEAQARSRQV